MPRDLEGLASALAAAWPDLPTERKQAWLRFAAHVQAQEPPMKSRFVDNWRWVIAKSHSIKLAALASAGLGWAVNHLDAIGAVIALAPPEVRAFIPLPVMMLAFGSILIARLWKQK